MYRHACATALLLIWSCKPSDQSNSISRDTAPLTEADESNQGDEGSQKNNNKALDALTVLEEHCYSCHGLAGSNQGGFDDVLDVEKLIETGMVIPGDADSSPLYIRVSDGEMPPVSINTRLTQREERAIRRWINVDLTKDIDLEEREFIRTEDEFASMLDDLATIDSGNRRFIRYLSISHLYNAGVREEELESHRTALSLAINRLSWAHQPIPPVAVDAPRKTIFRIDLRDYAWDDGEDGNTSDLWDTLIEKNTYAVLHLNTANALEVVTQTRTPVPVVRGDWFAAKATTAPLYYDLLQIPEELDSLEKDFLLVDPQANIDRLTAVRAGFNESGVSTNNRVIERHSTVFGAYWKSYDFSENFGLQNIFERPLGPGGGPAEFSHAGGEMIFELPNGLHGFMITDEFGARIDSAPVSIVSDPEQPDRTVIAGLSCMNCHEEGLIAKDDEIRQHVLANEDDYGASDLDKIFGLYVDGSVMDGLMGADKDRYAQAVLAAGGSTSQPDPTLALVREFEAVLDRRRAAVEVGLKESQLEILLLDPEVGDLLAPLKIDGGTIKRELFDEIFLQLACVVNYGVPLDDAAGCESPEYTGNRVDTRLDVTRKARARTEPLPDRLDED